MATPPVTRLFVALALAGTLGAASSAEAADPTALYKAGIAKKKSGDLTGAEESFAACLAADPKYGRCHFSIGVLKKKRGELGQAEAHFRAAIAAYPTWGQAHLSLGMTLLKKGASDEARVELEAAVADPELDAEDRAEAWNAVGVMHRQASRWKDAVAAYDKALAAKPDNASFHLNRAIALEGLDDLAGMEAAARRSTELKGDDAPPWVLLGRALLRQKKAAESVPAWQRATTLAPKEANAWFGLGEAAEQAGLKPEAVRAFEMYVSLVPSELERAPVKARLEKLRP